MAGIFGGRAFGAYEQAAAGIGQDDGGPLRAYDDGVFSVEETMLDGPLQAYRDGSMGQYEQAAAGIGQRWTRDAGEKWLGGLGAFSPGDPCAAANTVEYVQSVIGVSQDGVFGKGSRTALEKTGKSYHDIAPGCMGPCPKSPSGSMGYDQCGADTMKWCDVGNPNPDILALQKLINGVLVGQKYKSIPEDGLLGPQTCGAFVIPESEAYGVKGFPLDLMGEAIVKCDAWTIPTKVGEDQPRPPKTTIKPEEYALPWGVRDDRTASVQNDVNVQLQAHGYQPVTVDGVLNALTCGGMRLSDTWGQNWERVFGLNCKSFTTPAKVGGSKKGCPTGTRLVGQTCVVIPAACPSNYVRVGGQCRPLAQSCGADEELVAGKCVRRVAGGGGAGGKGKGYTMWIVGGLVGAAALTGVYFATRKKKAA